MSLRSFDHPPEDERVRAEAEWLLARESNPEAPPPSAQAASDYAELEDLLRTLPEGPPDDSWHAEVLRQLAATPAAEERQLSAAPAAEELGNGAASKQPPAAAAVKPQPPPWWRRSAFHWGLGGAFAAAAVAAIVLLLRPPSPPAEPRAIAIAVVQRAAVRSSSGKYAVGDRIRVTAISQEKEHGDLRIFRSDGTSSSLIARCPGELACKAAGGEQLVLDLTLQAPGRYFAILAEGKGIISPDASMNDFLDAAMSAGGAIPLREPFEVE